MPGKRKVHGWETVLPGGLWDRISHQGGGGVPDETSQPSPVAMCLEKQKTSSCHTPAPTMPSKPRQLSVQEVSLSSFFFRN